MGEPEDRSHQFQFESEVFNPGQEKRKEPIPEVETAVEELLVTALADTDARLGMSGGVGDISYTDPRICDMAAYSLSKRFKNKYPFDFSVPLHERDGQLLQLQNTWRLANRVNLLPLPVPRTNPGLPSERTSPLLANVASAETSEQRKHAIAELENLGIRALPAVLEFSETLPPDQPVRSELVALASQLANVITEIVIESKSIPTCASLKQKLKSMENERLQSKNFVAVLVDTVRDLPKGTSGVTVTAYRFNDNTGVRLTIQLSQGDLPSDRSAVAWRTHGNVEIDDVNLHNSFGSSSYDFAMNRDLYEDIVKSIEKALNSPPNVTVQLCLSLLCGAE